MPGTDTFRPRREVGAHLVVSGETKPHRDDSDKTLVVEDVPRNPHPGAQTLTGRVVVGQSAVVDAQTRRLACNQELSARAHAQDRPDTVRQVLRAEAAGTDFGKQAREALALVGHVMGGCDRGAMLAFATIGLLHLWGTRGSLAC